MVADRQTQALPEREPDFERFAAFAGFADAGRARGARCCETLLTVERHYAALFEREPDLGRRRQPRLHRHRRRSGHAADAGRHGLQGAVGDLRPHPRLAPRPHPRHAQHPGARAADRADAGAPGRRSREQPDRDAAFRLFDEFVTGLPAGVQLFSLLRANPSLLAPAGRPDGRGTAAGAPSERPCRPVRRDARPRLPRAPAGSRCCSRPSCARGWPTPATSRTRSTSAAAGRTGGSSRRACRCCWASTDAGAAAARAGRHRRGRDRQPAAGGRAAGW